MRRPALIRITAAALLAAAGSASGVAHAQDGGTRSLFAAGAGTRALSMGGAYAALADDAVGMLWNPGGLGRVERLQFEMGQTQYTVAGISDLYAAAVAPNWRWGAAAMTFRQFSVGGIERRDDRNLLLGGNTSDSQSEIALGYGRPVGENWSVGGTLKVRHQSLAEFSAVGFGADFGVIGTPALALGVRAPWAERLTGGVSFSNVVRPNLKLERETVADPSAVRTGLAYLVPLANSRTLVAALDIEQPQGLGARAHAGVALRLLPQLELRAGLSPGSFTAGSGFRWHDLAVDYVFESRDFESMHRLGIRFETGLTVAASHLAARQQEEAKIETRLEDGFQKRLADQEQSLLARARALRAQGDLDGSADVLSSAMVLDPGNAEATGLAVATHEDKARALEAAGDFAGAALAYGRVLALAAGDSSAASGLERCKTESGRRRSSSAEAAMLSSQAFEAFAADDLPAARLGYQRVLALDSLDTEATTMLRRTEERIARRAESLLDQARRLIDTEEVEDASALLAQIAVLDPRAEGLASLQSSLRQAREARQARAAAQARAENRVRPERGAPPVVAPSAPTLSRHELDLLYRRGLEALDQHRNDDAIRYWELVWAAAPDYQSVAEYLKRELLAQGMEAFASGRLADAVDSWRRVLRIDPKDGRATAYVARAQQQMTRTRQILGSER